MHRDMVRLVAFNFILRFIRIGMMRVSLVVDVLCMDLNDPAADSSGLGIPAHAVADFEAFRHAIFAGPERPNYTTTVSRFAARVMPV
jgi:hypothetical protein